MFMLEWLSASNDFNDNAVDQGMVLKQINIFYIWCTYQRRMPTWKISCLEQDFDARKQLYAPIIIMILVIEDS